MPQQTNNGNGTRRIITNGKNKVIGIRSVYKVSSLAHQQPQKTPTTTSNIYFTTTPMQQSFMCNGGYCNGGGYLNKSPPASQCPIGPLSRK
jgi:hypothetical protein